MKVSVLICAYNQQRYVEQAVRSALMQETAFPFELVIGEDCSTDDTREIVQRIAGQIAAALESAIGLGVPSVH